MKNKSSKIIIILSLILLINIFSFTLASANSEIAGQTMNYKTLDILNNKYNIMKNITEKYINNDGKLIGIDDGYTREYYQISYEDISDLDVDKEVLKFEDKKTVIENNSGLNTPIKDIGLYGIMLFIFTILFSIIFIIWMTGMLIDMFGKE